MKLMKRTGNGHENHLFPSSFGGLFDSMLLNDGISNLTKVPAVNISETKDHYMVELSAPGFDKSEFNIELDNDSLSISGEHKYENEEMDNENKSKVTYTRKEFGYGAFKRSFSLPDTVDVDKIDAKYENGILKIRLTKKEEAKPRPPKAIEIK
jgi:HSP20 family protein